MYGRSHLLVGAATVLAADSLVKAASGAGLAGSTAAIEPLPGLPVGVLPVLLLAGVFGALLPDLDHPNAALANVRFPFGLRPFKVPAQVTAALVRHRGPTHSLSANLLALAFGWLGERTLGVPGLGIALALGYLSHLLTDALTYSGVPLLWPVRSQAIGFPPNKRYRLRSGGWQEALIVVGSWGITAGIVALAAGT